MRNTYHYHIATEETYHDSEIIFREGASGDWLYVILIGAVEISKTVQERKHIIEVLQPGEVFGELEFFGLPRRTVTARAIGETTLGIIDREFLEMEFNQLSAQFRGILKSITRRFENILDRASDFSARAAPRVPKALSLVFKDRQAFFRTYTANVSSGGLFIKTENPLGPGQQFLVKLQLPDVPDPLQIKCEVIWTRKRESSKPNSPPGMGVKFSEISERDHKVLKEFLAATEKDT